MTKSQCLGFCNCVGKFREPPVKGGVLVGNFGKGERVNGSLPFLEKTLTRRKKDDSY
jgi:hypothetical protein